MGFEGEDGLISGALRDYTRRHGFIKPATQEGDRQVFDELRQQAESRYLEMGFTPVYTIDAPDKVYEPHAHHEVYLFGLAGFARIRVGEEQIEMIRGVEVHIPEGVEHEATVGPEGAEYIFAHPKDIKPFTYREG
jgi:hypothetical protein